MLEQSPSPYLAYVLRLWCDGPDAPWRAALESARTGERHPFADLAALFAFLEAETQDAQPLSLSMPVKDTGQGAKSQMR